ncbi:MAG: efflux RND transporter periplasmic adaptor subunit [Thermosynechococcaceae cyanobacterium]
MTFTPQRSRLKWRKTSVTFVSALLLTIASPSVLAHGGHGSEFQGDSAPAAGSIQVDTATAKRMGLNVASVRRQSLALSIKATGQIETSPNRKVEVTTPIIGTVTQLLAQPGDRVQAGQPVAILSSSEIAGLRVDSIQKRSEAEADLRKAEADLRLAQQNTVRQRQIASADLRQAQSQLAFAQEKYDRDRDLLKVGAIPRRQVLETETQLMEVKSMVAKSASRLDFLQAESDLQKAQSDVSLARSRIQLSDAGYKARLKQLGGSANTNGTVTIKAPISGTVADREVTLGESGQDAGKPIMTILNDRSVLVAANVYEKDLGQIKVGQQVQVKVASLPNRTFVGRISVIGSAVEGETRVVPVKAELDNPDGLLKPGMFAELNLLTGRSSTPVLAIPQSAIVETNDKKTVVFVQNGNAYQPAEVSLGQTSGDLVEIKSGLFDGDRVVVQRATQLYAQSLRGDAPKAEEKTETPAAAATGGNLQNLVLPWWGLIALSGAIATSTFWASTYWAKRSSRKEIALASDGDPFESNHLGSNNGADLGSHLKYGERSSDLPQPEAVEAPHQRH